MADELKTGAANPGAEFTHLSKSLAQLRPLLIAIALVTWACLRFPQATLDATLDPSWMAVLIYAHEKGLQFGRDVVFTYGPLGFLTVKCFSTSCAALRIIFEIVSGFGIATGLCLMAWRLILPWRLALLGFFIFISCPLHWGGAGLFFDLGLFAWGWLCFLESGCLRLRIFVSTLAVLAAAAALIKFTFLVTGLFTLGLLALDLVLRRRRVLAAAMLTGFLLAFLLGWLALGQSLSGLGAYLSNSYAVASGYNEAMGSNAENLAWVLIMTLAALAAVTIRTLGLNAGSEWPSRRRGALLVWLGGLLFMTWKYGCVRNDPNHVDLMLGVVPIIAMSLEALPVIGKRALLGSRLAVLLCLAGVLVLLHGEIPGFFPAKCAIQAGHNMTANLGVLVQPAWYVHEQTEALQAEQKKYQYPVTRSAVSNATVDIFGQNQGIAILNEFNYRPRPAFQSYTAYTRPLMELNERFYLSKDAPEYVLFNLQAIDGRFPPLEDAFVLRDLPASYALLFREGDFLLLRRKAAAKVQLALLKEGTVSAGEKIDLQNQSGADLWLEIELRPTLFGRLRQFLYKPPDTQLVVWGQPGAAGPVKYHAPATMLSSGFLASPLVLNNDDAVGVYTGGKPRLADAFSVELAPDILSDWQPQVHFRMYRIEK